MFCEKGLGKLGWDPGVERLCDSIRVRGMWWTFISFQAYIAYEDPTTRPAVSLVGGSLRTNFLSGWEAGIGTKVWVSLSESNQKKSATDCTGIQL